MRPRPREEGDGLSGQQVRLLLAISLGLGAVLLLAVLGITGASYVYGAGGSDGPPDAAFSTVTEQRGDDVVMNVTHRGGDAVDPALVDVTVNGERRGNWSSLGGEGLGVVAPSHSLVLTDVEPGDDVRLLWLGAEDGDPVELDRGTVDEP